MKTKMRTKTKINKKNKKENENKNENLSFIFKFYYDTSRSPYNRFLLQLLIYHGNHLSNFIASKLL